MEMFYYAVSWILFVFTAIITVITVFRKNPEQGNGLMTGKADTLLDFVSKYRVFFFLAILVVFIFTRLYHLSALPVGLHVDELGMAYDAYSLAHFGMDRHHVGYPVYLENYGGGQSSLYAYLVALLLKFLPYSVTVIRLPAVICGVFCFFGSYFLVRDVIGDTDRKWLYLLGPLFVTITPYFLMSERWGLDCNLFLSLATVSLCVLGRALSGGKSRTFFAAGLCFGVTLYTYALSYFVIPLFVLFVFVYIMLVKKNNKGMMTKFVIFMIPLVVLGTPLLLFQLVNMGIIGEFDIGPVQFRKLTYYRSSEISLSNIFANLLGPLKCMYGTDGLSYNAFKEFGPIYFCMVPPLILGMYQTTRDTVISLKEGKMKAVILLPAYFLASYLAMLLPVGFGFGLSNYIFISFIVFAAYGICTICIKSRARALAIVICLCLSFLVFLDFYFLRQNGVYGYHTLFMSTKPGDMIAYAEDNYDPLHEKRLYVCMNYDDNKGIDLYAGLYGDVPASIWEPDKTDMGDIYLNLPDEYDPNEDAVYIVGEDWGGVISALIADGFADDNLFEREHILHK